MNNSSEPDQADNLWSVSSYKEMEYRLNSLCSLVCDLLKKNQELRDALAERRQNSVRPRPNG
jgi:hypothetical protein